MTLSATKYTPERSKKHEITRWFPALRNTRPRDQQQIRHLICPKQQSGGSRSPPTRNHRMGAIPWEATSHQRIGPKTGVGSYPKKETSHHASLKEYGSFKDRRKWKLRQANKYRSRVSCPITTGSARISTNTLAFHSRIITKEIQTRESNN